VTADERRADPSGFLLHRHRPRSDCPLSPRSL